MSIQYQDSAQKANDKQDRPVKEYSCPCGKEYYSYPALYTHVKSVHRGVAPGKVKRPIHPPRGRPKNNQFKRLQLYGQALRSELHANPVNLLALINQDHRQRIQSQSREAIEIYNFLQKNSLICARIEQKVKAQQNKKTRIEPEFLQQFCIFDITTLYGLANFLAEAKLITSKALYTQIMILVTFLVQHMKEQTGNDKILKDSKVGLVLQFLNDFVLNGIAQRRSVVAQWSQEQKPRYEKFQKFKVNTKQIQIFYRQKQEQNSMNNSRSQNQELISGIWIMKRMNAIRVLEILSKWLIYNQYTMIKARINEDYIE